MFLSSKEKYLYYVRFVYNAYSEYFYVNYYSKTVGLCYFCLMRKVCDKKQKEDCFILDLKTIPKGAIELV